MNAQEIIKTAILNRAETAILKNQITLICFVANKIAIGAERELKSKWSFFFLVDNFVII